MTAEETSTFTPAMALSTSSLYFNFLRPLALPHASTLSRFLSTSSTSPTKSSSPSSQPSKSKLSTESAGSILLPYRVLRTPSQQLPIYNLAKRGGNLKQTRLRKIEGDINVLRAHLQKALGLEDKEVVINQLTRHIIVKGHRKADIAKFLEDRKF